MNKQTQPYCTRPPTNIPYGRKAPRILHTNKINSRVKINVKTHQALTLMRTSPSATAGSGFFSILTDLSPPKPVSTTARISLGGSSGVFSASSLTAPSCSGLGVSSAAALFSVSSAMTCAVCVRVSSHRTIGARLRTDSSEQTQTDST